MTSEARGAWRSPLSQAALRGEVLPGSRLYTSLRVVARTGSTNADLLAAARAGAAEGAVLAAEEQTAGRGRLDRAWQSRAGASLTFSVLLRPARVPAALRGWLPLLAGVAVARALRAQTGLDIGLKWPNDVLCGPGKLAGILAEQDAGQPGAIVVGVGLNVSASRDELPTEAATSLALQGVASPDRQGLLVAILRDLEAWYLPWANGSQPGTEPGTTPGAGPGDPVGSGLRPEYLRLCATLGREVRVELPGSVVLTGRACDVDDLGRLIVTTGSGPQAVSAGDVIHVR